PHIPANASPARTTEKFMLSPRESCCFAGAGHQGPAPYPSVVTVSEAHAYPEAVRAAHDVVEARRGPRDAASSERRGLVEQVVDRPEELELLDAGQPQVIPDIEREVHVGVDPVVIDAAEQEVAVLVLVARAVRVVAPGVVQVRAT